MNPLQPVLQRPFQATCPAPDEACAHPLQNTGVAPNHDRDCAAFRGSSSPGTERFLTTGNDRMAVSWASLCSPGAGRFGEGTVVRFVIPQALNRAGKAQCAAVGLPSTAAGTR